MVENDPEFYREFSLVIASDLKERYNFTIWYSRLSFYI